MFLVRSNQPEADQSFWRQNEVTFVMTMIGSLLPKFFGSLELLEKYHPRKAMQYMLARIMILNLLNLYSLIFALIQKTNSMSTELHNFKMMNDSSLISGQTTVLAMAESVECFNIPIPCHVLDTMEAKMIEDEEFGLKYRFECGHKNSLIISCLKSISIHVYSGLTGTARCGGQRSSGCTE